MGVKMSKKQSWNLIAVFLTVALLLARIGIRMIIQSFKPMIVMMVFLLVINVLTVRTGGVLFTVGTFSVYHDAHAKDH